MNNVESRRDEREGSFAWVMPLIFVVFILTLSWTSVFVVVRGVVEAASRTSLTMDTFHE